MVLDELDGMDRNDDITGGKIVVPKVCAMAYVDHHRVDELAKIVRRAATGMDAHDVDALLAHPDALTSALTETAVRVSARGAARERIEGETPSYVDEAAARERLARHAKVGVENGLLTSDEVASLAGLKSRQTVHDWRTKGRVISWQGAKRGMLYPRGQFDERGRPLPGIEELNRMFPDGYAAWSWLTTPSAALDRTAPIERLRAGEVEQVLAAARGDAQGDFA